MLDLREVADANYYFGEIKMWHENHRKLEVGIVVEAKSDERLFGAHFHTECVFFGFGGWEKVVKIIEQVNQHKIEGVVGIIDADFKRILGNSKLIANLFMTDFHDSEMMLVHSSAWDEMLKHYADTRKTSKGTGAKLLAFEEKHQKTIKDFLLELLKPLSALRQLNEKECLGLTFRVQSKKGYKYLDYSNFISKDDLKLNVEQLIKAVENKSQKQGFFKNDSNLRGKLNDLIVEEFDLKEICNGHDLLYVLSLALEKAIGNKSSPKISADEIGTILIVAYRFEDLEKTNLYLALRMWEIDNFPHQLFAKLFT